MTYPGVYAATVVGVDLSGVVVMRIPQVHGPAPLAVPPLYPETAPAPTTGTRLWVVFEGGDPIHPYYLPRPTPA